MILRLFQKSLQRFIMLSLNLSLLKLLLLPQFELQFLHLLLLRKDLIGGGFYYFYAVYLYVYCLSFVAKQKESIIHQILKNQLLLKES